METIGPQNPKVDLDNKLKNAKINCTCTCLWMDNNC